MAQDDLKEARAIILASGFELTEKECRRVIWNVSIAVEAILGVMYHIHKKVQPDEKSFGELLNELRDEMIEEYGVDIFEDLDFIRYWRNKVNHPSPIRVLREIAFKVVKKAELFFELFFLKIGLRVD